MSFWVIWIKNIAASTTTWYTVILLHNIMAANAPALQSLFLLGSKSSPEILHQVSEIWAPCSGTDAQSPSDWNEGKCGGWGEV